MATLDDFWIALHGLATLLEQAGGSTNARVARIADSFHAMPPVARQELLRLFELVAGDLAALGPLIRD